MKCPSAGTSSPTRRAVAVHWRCFCTTAAERPATDRTLGTRMELEESQIVTCPYRRVRQASDATHLRKRRLSCPAAPSPSASVAQKGPKGSGPTPRAAGKGQPHSLRAGGRGKQPEAEGSTVTQKCNQCEEKVAPDDRP